MAQASIHTTIVGRLVADPELHYISDGKPVASFTIASSQRVYNKQAGQWEDGDATFLDCVAWQKLAEGVATLRKGQRVVAVGVLKQRRWEGQNGQKRSKLELVADEVGTSVLFAGSSNGVVVVSPETNNKPAKTKTRGTIPAPPIKTAGTRADSTPTTNPPFKNNSR